MHLHPLNQPFRLTVILSSVQLTNLHSIQSFLHPFTSPSFHPFIRPTHNTFIHSAIRLSFQLTVLSFLPSSFISPTHNLFFRSTISHPFTLQSFHLSYFPFNPPFISPACPACCFNFSYLYSLNYSCKHFY